MRKTRVKDWARQIWQRYVSKAKSNVQTKPSAVPKQKQERRTSKSKVVLKQSQKQRPSKAKDYAQISVGAQKQSTKVWSELK